MYFISAHDLAVKRMNLSPASARLLNKWKRGAFANQLDDLPGDLLDILDGYFPVLKACRKELSARREAEKPAEDFRKAAAERTARQRHVYTSREAALNALPFHAEALGANPGDVKVAEVYDGYRLIVNN